MSMIINPYVFAGVTYQAMTQAWLDEMDTPLDATRAGIVDAFVIAATPTILQKLDGFYIHALPLSQQSRLNLSYPTGSNAELNINGSPTFTANVGWQGNSNIANTLSTPQNVSALTYFTQNSASFGIYTSTTPSGNVTACGTSDANNWIVPNYLGSHTYARINMNANSALNLGGGGNGLHAANRTNSTTYQVYKNGSQLTSATGASVALTATPFRICSNGATVPSNAVIGASFIGGSLTSGEHATLYAALNTMMGDLAAV
jgi:hypothetical protein